MKTRVAEHGRRWMAKLKRFGGAVEREWGEEKEEEEDEEEEEENKEE